MQPVINQLSKLLTYILTILEYFKTSYCLIWINIAVHILSTK